MWKVIISLDWVALSGHSRDNEIRQISGSDSSTVLSECRYLFLQQNRCVYMSLYICLGSFRPLIFLSKNDLI